MSARRLFVICCILDGIISVSYILLFPSLRAVIVCFVLALSPMFFESFLPEAPVPKKKNKPIKPRYRFIPPEQVEVKHCRSRIGQSRKG